MVFRDLTVTGAMNARGEVLGDWVTTIGTGGTFHLFPHASGEQSEVSSATPQFHVARHHFGAIEINRAQVTAIAENIQQDFGAVAITVVAGTEQARYLDDFKKLQFSADAAEIIKIFAQRPDGTGANEVVSIEFGPQVNTIMTQGTSEAWVLGRLETLKGDLKRYERTYVTNFKRWGIGINQFLLLGAVVFLPSLKGLSDRAILMGAVLLLIVVVNWLHTRYVPFAAIHLREKRQSFLGRIGPSISSWVIGIVATAVAASIGAYLQGWLDITLHKDPPAANEKKAG